MQKDCPGDIDPEKKEEQRRDTAVDTGVGFVVHYIKNKTTFREIPDQRGDKRAYDGCLCGYRGIGGELIGDIEECPNDKIG